MEIGKIAISQGMKTLRMVALDKVREGVSTLEQVLVADLGALIARRRGRTIWFRVR